jgi:MEDS: MEthanogen/methylotroph, DcmR Sensory domain
MSICFRAVNQSEFGVHYMIIYPDLFTTRGFYSDYIRKQIEENNEIVLINPFYETTDSVRYVLSQYKHGMNVSKYEKEKALIIIDSLKEYFGQQPYDMSFKKSLVSYAKQIGKNGLSILGDIGAYPHKSKYKDLVDYELSLPTKYDDVAMKGFCLYHEKDFDKFADEQKQKLIEHHGKAIEIIKAQ